ncbi:thylakoid membrane protein slr0575-like [Senna tora]|uniref:Thylakoid membrane protein slr0575-like n=1 Tax=Senna tora TaxID=362788 RepID=A0A834SWT1_9FABA|nr:thylakoid membrane protein slr0575-like [Senna tora]
MLLRAAPSPAGGAVVCSGDQFGLCHRYRFISLTHSARGHLNKCRSQPSRSSNFIQLQSNGGIFAKRHSSKLVFTPRAADSTQSASIGVGNKTVVPDEGFSVSKISFGVVGLGVGISLLSYGFGAYFNILPGSEWSALMLTYGFPLAIIGMALKYAELKPVPCLTYVDAQNLREKCATPILKQVKNDVTRYRYGDEQHLDEALQRIFQYGLGGGIPRRNGPVLQMIREEVTQDGKYCLVLVFEAKALELSVFEKRQAKFTSFFGPGITAEVGKGEKEDLYEVRLISNTDVNASSSS